MVAAVEIDLPELRRVVEILLNDLEQQGYRTVRLDDDYYWEIPKEDLYSPYAAPKDLAMGQLTHDWERLQEILHGSSSPLAYGLVWLSSLLRAIGQKVIH